MTSTTDIDLWVIYGLRAADDPEYRYVGYTTIGISRRLAKHKKDAITRDYHVHRWIRSVGRGNIVIDPLEICPAGDLLFISEAESKWISKLRLEGCRLTNLNDGGVGGNSGAKHTDDTKKKISQSLAASDKIRGENHWNFGRNLSTEHKMKMSKSLTGMVHTEDTKARFREIAANRDDTFRIEKTRQANHTRWHVNRNVVKADCTYCIV